MRKFGFYLLVIIGIVGVTVFYSYNTISKSHKEDVIACKNVDRNNAEDALINRLTDPKNSTFGEKNLKKNDIEIRNFEVGYSGTNTEFTITKEPNVVYFAMQSCSNPSDIEFAKK